MRAEMVAPLKLAKVRRNGRALGPLKTTGNNRRNLAKLSTAGLWIGRLVHAEMVAPGRVVRAEMVAPLRRNGRGPALNWSRSYIEPVVPPVSTSSYLYPVVEAAPSVDNPAG